MSGNSESRRRYRLAIGLGLVAYFFLMSWDTWKTPFAPDDMVAIWTYWHPPPIRLLVSQVMLWHGYLRPVGGFFYLPLFQAFGLNPVPYHVVLLLLLLAGAWLMYRLARELGCGDLPAALVALIACYHPGLSNLYYNSVFVFDVLCGIFFFATLAYYVRIRSANRILSPGEMVIFLALYLCALNSKEMAFTMPPVLLAYEWLFRKLPAWRPRALVTWLRGPGAAICWTAAFNVVFLYGKRFGQEGLMKNGASAYTPQFSLDRLRDFQERYLGDIFCHLPRLEWPAVLVLWAIVTWLAWRRNRPLLRFCWFYVVLTPLPIAFLPFRDQACLYVPLAGWAVMGATLFQDWLPGATRVLGGEPLFRRLEPVRLRAVIIGAAVAVWIAGNVWFKAEYVSPILSQVGGKTTEVLAEMRAVNPQVPRGAKVVFLEDPWPEGGFDMAFIADLWFRDRATRVFLNQKSRLGPEEIAAASAVFTWTDGKLIRVR